MNQKYFLFHLTSFSLLYVDQKKFIIMQCKGRKKAYLILGAFFLFVRVKKINGARCLLKENITTSISEIEINPWLVCCRYKSKCLLVGPGTKDGVATVGGLSKGS